MSERTANAGVATLLAIDISDEEFGYEMLTLLELVDFEYERWARVMGRDPDDPDTLRLYNRAFYAYPVVWNRMGEAAFDKLIAERAPKWRTMLA